VHACLLDAKSAKVRASRTVAETPSLRSSTSFVCVRPNIAGINAGNSSITTWRCCVPRATSQPPRPQGAAYARSSPRSSSPSTATHQAALRVVWEGGAITDHSVPLPCTGNHTRATDQDVALVRRIAEHYPRRPDSRDPRPAGPPQRPRQPVHRRPRARAARLREITRCWPCPPCGAPGAGWRSAPGSTTWPAGGSLRRP
jgi:hypothetical protein